MKVVALGMFYALFSNLGVPGIRAQDNPDVSMTKHLTVFPVNGVRPVQLSALNIQRGAEYPSVVELKGDVEIRTRVCVRQSKPGDKTGRLACDGETIVRADEVTYHEDTGTVEARGKVTIATVPYQHGK